MFLPLGVNIASFFFYVFLAPIIFNPFLQLFEKHRYLNIFRLKRTAYNYAI